MRSYAHRHHFQKTKNLPSTHNCRISLFYICLSYSRSIFLTFMGKNIFSIFKWWVSLFKSQIREIYKSDIFDLSDPPKPDKSARTHSKCYLEYVWSFSDNWKKKLKKFWLLTVEKSGFLLLRSTFSTLFVLFRQLTVHIVPDTPQTPYMRDVWNIEFIYGTFRANRDRFHVLLTYFKLGK